MKSHTATEKPTSFKFRAIKFLLVGVGLTICQFLIYTLIARLINNNNLLWLDSAISYIISTFLAYFAHSRITWKERRPTKTGIVNFFLWNFLTALVISPLFTMLFGLITPLYELGFNISSAIHLPFDYNFIESTGIFVLTTTVTMILNYFFYDRLVFGDKSKKKIKLTKNNIIAIIFYALPIIFFFISYFLLTTSGEDIHQGANNLANGGTLDPFGDMARAFEHSGRFTDMYAWSIIDVFDYQYSFGVDTFFRLIDVAVISGAFYLATYIALRRRPRLEIKDSLVFCAIFSAVIFSPFGRRLYSEFSMIHNYAPLVLLTCAFTLPYIKLMEGKSFKEKFDLSPKALAIILTPLGFFFGMSTTITPIAVIATIIIYMLIKHKEIKRPPLWFFIGIGTTLIGFIVSFFLSPGMNSYATNPASAETFDYIAISDIFAAPATEVPHVFNHLVYNFGICLAPLAIYFIITFIAAHGIKHPIKNLKNVEKGSSKIIITLSIFIFIHILATAQIKTPPRILIPAYLAGIVLIARLYTPYIKSKIFATGVVILTTLAIIIHTVFLSIYHVKAAEVLNEIKSSEKSSLCIDRSRVESPRIPIINLSQEFILVDWGYPEYIYGKAVTFCSQAN